MKTLTHYAQHRAALGYDFEIHDSGDSVPGRVLYRACDTLMALFLAPVIRVAIQGYCMIVASDI